MTLNHQMEVFFCKSVQFTEQYYGRLYQINNWDDFLKYSTENQVYQFFLLFNLYIKVKRSTIPKASIETDWNINGAPIEHFKEDFAYQIFPYGCNNRPISKVQIKHRLRKCIRWNKNCKQWGCFFPNCPCYKVNGSRELHCDANFIKNHIIQLHFAIVCIACGQAFNSERQIDVHFKTSCTYYARLKLTNNDQRTAMSEHDFNASSFVPESRLKSFLTHFPRPPFSLKYFSEPSDEPKEQEKPSISQVIRSIPNDMHLDPSSINYTLPQFLTDGLKLALRMGAYKDNDLHFRAALSLTKDSDKILSALTYVIMLALVNGSHLLTVNSTEINSDQCRIFSSNGYAFQVVSRNNSNPVLPDLMDAQVKAGVKYDKKEKTFECSFVDCVYCSKRSPVKHRTRSQCEAHIRCSNFVLVCCGCQKLFTNPEDLNAHFNSSCTIKTSFDGTIDQERKRYNFQFKA